MDLKQETRAMHAIVRTLKGLKTPASRKRVLDYVSQWAWQEGKDGDLFTTIKDSLNSGIEDISHKD